MAQWLMREIPREWSGKSAQKRYTVTMGVNDHLTFSAAGQAVTKHFEGLRLRVYPDSGGYPTIGWGHKCGPDERVTITEAQAQAQFEADCAAAETVVKTAVASLVQLTQGQFDCLCDFVFNVGAGLPGRRDGFVWLADNSNGPRHSSLLNLVNSAAPDPAIIAEIGKWKHGHVAGALHSVVLPALVKRRAAEAALWAGQVPVLA